MQFAFFPADPFEGTLQSLSNQSDSVFTPVSMVLTSIATIASNVRVRKHSVVVEMEQADFDAFLQTLTGWTGQAVQKSSTVSAFEGSMAYHVNPKDE